MIFKLLPNEKYPTQIVVDVLSDEDFGEFKLVYVGKKDIREILPKATEVVPILQKKLATRFPEPFKK